MNFFKQSISVLRGVGKVREKFYIRLNISTFKDLLFFLPNQYVSLSSELVEKRLIVIKIKVLKKEIIKANFFKIYANFNNEVIIFNLYNKRLYNIFFPNQFYNIGGYFEKKNDSYEINDLKIFNNKQEYFVIYDHGISSYSFQKLIIEILKQMPFDEEIINNLKIKSIFYNIHHGIDYENSLYALKYLEALFFIKTFSKQEEYDKQTIDLDEILKDIPFILSDKQINICKKIQYYLSGQMNYLVYGEVGSGKTIIAIIAALMVLNMGFNIVFLAPTVALAFQHYEEVTKIINANDCLLYTSFTKQKRKIKDEIANNKYKIIISTHALLYLDNIANIGLIIIDEIHKFGVAQRSKLMHSAVRKNLLLLTATPIPRSLSMILNEIINYDILPSYMPKNTETYWIKKDKLELLFDKIKNKKVYWILPNIEDSNEILGVLTRYNILKEKFENVILLHGKLKDKEKLEAVKKFKETDCAILVATTIVEIGINITDADIIIIENAERFGLSQLHQLRGRIGRNGQESYCFLVSEYMTKKISYMKKYKNGNDISEKDLEIRKSGRLTGLLQHGCSAFYFLEEEDNNIFKLAKKDKKECRSFEMFDEFMVSY